MRGQKYFFWVHWNLFFKLLKHGLFWINFRFWLVWVELRKSKALSSLNFLQRHEKFKEKKLLGIIKAKRVFESPILCIWQFECSVYIFRGPWLIKGAWISLLSYYLLACDEARRSLSGVCVFDLVRFPLNPTDWERWPELVCGWLFVELVRPFTAQSCSLKKNRP